MDLTTNAPLPHVTLQEVAIRLCVAFVGGFLVTVIYKNTRPATHVTRSFPPTLVLLAVLIGVVTQVIGNNAARAFSLVGVLSIVRFRTIVRDTQDTAFVIFAVVMGMAAGAGNYPIAAMGLVLGGFTAFVVRAKHVIKWTDIQSSLSLRLGLGADPKVLLTPVFEKHFISHETLTITTVRQGAALDYVYRVHLKPDSDPAALVKELNGLDGVQNVELRRGEPDDV